MTSRAFLLYLSLVFSACSSDDNAFREIAITTNEASNVTHNSIMVGGTVSGNPIDEKGLAWALSPNPTVDDNALQFVEPKEGTFELKLSDLDRNTTYHIRAYAVQDGSVFYGENLGVSTSNFVAVPYGNDVLFVSPTDNAREVAWGPSVFVGATSQDDGASNTSMLTSEGSQFIARICAQYNGGGYDDWYLPAEDELLAIVPYSGEIGGVQTLGYWSSTEVSANQARAINISSGTVSNAPKTSLLNCRCVRKETAD